MSIKATVKADALQGFAAELTRRVITRPLKMVAFALQAEIQTEAPVDQGTLRQSIQSPKQLNDFAFEISIGANYWQYVQFGTGLHGPNRTAYDIYPKNKKALAFKVAGEQVVVKYVKDHPGMKANPFIDRAIDAVTEKVPGIVARELERA